ncbi:hypothetical protein ABPH35_10950, partial [Streptococcus sp. ZJ93]
IVDEIIKGRGDYCLAVKGNQGTLYEDISLYFSDAKLLDQLAKRAAFNLNVIRKMCLYFLKVIQFPKSDLSYCRKQRYISVYLDDYLPQLFGK